MNRSAAQSRTGVSTKRSVPGASQSREAARDYIAAMAGSLAELALANRLDSVAVACDVVREIAEGNVNAEARLVRVS